MDTAVCNGSIANISCGFVNANPSIVVPDWIIITRSEDGSVISNITVIGSAIIAGNFNDLQWLPDLTSGDNSAPNSRLLVGPLSGPYNRSSYQCYFTVDGGIIMSNIGTLTVTGRYISVYMYL